MRTRKRKTPLSGIDRLQIANLYTPVIRPRNKRTSDYDSQLIIDAFLPNSKIVWGLTSNCTICKNGDVGFTVRLNKRERKNDRKASRRSSVLYKRHVKVCFFDLCFFLFFRLSYAFFTCHLTANGTLSGKLTYPFKNVFPYTFYLFTLED